MPKHIDFYSAKPHRAAIGLANLTLPLALRSACGVARVNIPDTDFERLILATANRCLITPNHPSRVEPMVVGDLARRAGRRFYFICARENFELFGGPFLQRLGAYSIARGTPDRTSIAMTRSLLAEKDRQVVLFPEGEIYHHNDMMLPLNSGAAQIGFWALADIVKLGKPLRLPILPIAVKYKFLSDPFDSTAARISRLESATGVGTSDGSLRDRVWRIGLRIVDTLEKRYRLAHTGDLTERLDRIKSCIISRGLAILSVDQPGGTLPEQTRFLFNAVREFKCGLESPASAYEERILSQRLVQIQLVMEDLSRVYDGLMTSGHYVSDLPTYERLGDMLGRLEDEVFGRHVKYMKREAIVRVGEPLALETFWDEYGKNKRAVVTTATAEIARRLAGLLQDLSAEGNPIPERLWPRRERENCSVVEAITP